MHTLDLNILGARRVYQSVDRDASSCSTTAMKTSSNEDNEHASLENSFLMSEVLPQRRNLPSRSKPTEAQTFSHSKTSC